MAGDRIINMMFGGMYRPRQGENARYGNGIVNFPPAIAMTDKSSTLEVRPWVDTTRLVGGVETPYVDKCNVHWKFTTNRMATSFRYKVETYSIDTRRWYVTASGDLVTYLTSGDYSKEIMIHAANPHQTNSIYRVTLTYVTRIGELSSRIYVARDYDGNVYNLTKIGSQWWTCENMRAVHYADGTAIQKGEHSLSAATPYYYEYTARGINIFSDHPLLGRLYNWPASTNRSDGRSDANIQGVAPTGFHIPSNSEFEQFIQAASGGSQYFAARCCDNRYYRQFPSQGMDYNQYYKWNEDSRTEVAGNYDSEDRNETMFCALPSGYNSGANLAILERGYFRSSTSDPNNSYNSYVFSFGMGNSGLLRSSYQKDYSVSVRCICNYDLDTL